jgi:hypothetical protein
VAQVSGTVSWVLLLLSLKLFEMLWIRKSPKEQLPSIVKRCVIACFFQKALRTSLLDVHLDVFVLQVPI